MAIDKKRMRQRRGTYANFDLMQAFPQELQIVTEGDPNTKDGKAIYLPIKAGELKRIVTADELPDVATDAAQQVHAEITGYLNDVRAAAEFANNKGQYAADKATEAEKAAINANSVAQSIIDMRDNGEFQGPPGEKGDKGDSGVTAPAKGFFALEVDSDGNLYANYGEDINNITFDYSSDNGELWAEIGV